MTDDFLARAIAEANLPAPKAYSALLAEGLEHAGITLDELAKRLGVSAQQITDAQSWQERSLILGMLAGLVQARPFR